MRTTLNLDDDVHLAAKELARRNGSSIGAVISELARKGSNVDPPEDTDDASDSFCGFHPIPKGGKPVTNEIINRLRGDW